MRAKEKFNKKLLVEGNDDQHVVWALCDRFTIPENFDVVDCEGIGNLISQIPVRMKQSGIESIGIVIDADSDITSRWNKISGLLNSLGYQVPVVLPENGLIINHNDISIGLWIMPNNSLSGMIEDFVRFLVPDNDELLKFAQGSLDAIENGGLNKYNPIHKSKALIHTWLSWQEDPGTPMGASITKRYLTTDAVVCNTFVDWLNRLFS